MNGGKNYINWGTNLMGMVRIQAQMQKNIKTIYIGYTLVFLVLVFYTMYFIFTYLRRVLYMAFLTIIAPFVAMTYPIDKINDGKAQAFNMWLKEYIFNLLIQPMHLILYTILIGSVFELASENVIYSLVAIGFLIPAEKLLRKFFGFEKAQTPGLLGGAAGAAMTMAAMNKVLSKGGSGGRGGSGSGSGSSSKDGGDSIKQKLRTDPSFDKKDAMLGEGSDYKQSPSNPNDSPTRNSSESNGNMNDDVIDLPEDEDLSNNMGTGEMPLLEDKSMENDNLDFDDTETMLPDNFNNDFNIIDVDPDELKPVDESPEKTKKPTLRQKLDDRYGAEARYYASGLKDKMANKIKNSSPLKTTLRVAGGLAAGAFAGGIGLAAGIASGDLGNVAKYGGGAALGGYKLGSNKMSGLPQAFEVEGMEEIRERAKYETEEEHIKAKQKEYLDDFRKNKENQYKLEKKYGKEKAKKVMEKIAPDCIKYGIDKVEDVITINEMIDKGVVKDAKMGASTAKYASTMGDVTKMTGEDQDKWRDTVKRDFAKNKRVQKENMDTNKIANDVMNRVESYYKIKSKL